MERALQVKSTLESFLQQFHGEECPSPLTQRHWSILELVVEIIRPFKNGADKLEKRKIPSGVYLVEVVEGLLLTQRMILPGSESIAEIQFIFNNLQQERKENIMLSLRERILQNENHEELFMLIRYLWAGI